MDLASTIVARGSAAGRSTRAMVRMSGEACAATFAALGGDEAFRRGAATARLRVGGGTLPCVAFRATGPASFTGEDVLELVVPGNPDLVELVERALLDEARRLGFAARPAAPGEFTLRAFTRGRIDLAQAEGVAATIAATTELQLKAARQLADGGLGRFVAEVAERMADDLALVEAGIDFTDQEDVVAIAPARLAKDLDEAIAAIGGRLARSVPMERFEAVPRVVLAGPPNAGKSSLFNALLGRRRAVESPIAGTTRDAIEEVVALESPAGRCEIRLIDVAGFDDAATGFNPAMQERVRDAIERADLVIDCVPADGDTPATAVDRTRGTAAAARLCVTTKVDLALGTPNAPDTPAPAVSARTGAGLGGLRLAIIRALAARLATLSDETVVLAARHESALRHALSALEECRAVLATSALRAPELVAASLRAALDSLGTISGQIAPDEVLGRIFGRFCIGK